MGGLSAYELNALREIENHKNTIASRGTRTLLSEEKRAALNQRGSQVAANVQRIPGFGKAAAAAKGGYLQAAAGLGKGLSRASGLSLSEDRVIRGYRRRNHDVRTLADIRALDLELVERRAKPLYLDFLYAAAAAAEGAGAGLAISGGEILAVGGDVAGAGAGAAPGLATVTGVVAFDAAAVLALCTRAIGHTALYYGYDPRDPAEAIYAMGVMNLGSAVTSGGKLAAYTELSKVTQALARNATWDTLNKHVLPRLTQKFAEAFGVRLTKQKLGAFVPVAGIAVGAGLNYRILDQVTDAAYWTYRERFINDKRGIYIISPPSIASVDPSEGREENIDILGMLSESDDESEND